MHAGDRTTFDLMVENLGAGEAGAPGSEATRKQAFLGNSSIWGVQARLRGLTQIIAPSLDDPTRMDNAMVGGVFGYRRLRPDVSWPIGQRVLQLADGDRDALQIEAIDGEAGEVDGIPLMRDYCSRPVPELRNHSDGEYTITELAEGPVGNRGALDCVLGWVLRKFTTIEPPEGERYLEHVLRLDTPVEAAYMDLLVHESLPFKREPKLCLASTLHGPPKFPLAERPALHLPSAGSVEYLGSGPPNVNTRHLAEYPEIVATAARKLGRDLSEFRGYRFEMSFPPVPSVVDLYFKLD